MTEGAKNTQHEGSGHTVYYTVFRGDIFCTDLYFSSDYLHYPIDFLVSTKHYPAIIQKSFSRGRSSKSTIDAI